MFRRKNDIIDSLCSYCSRPYNSKTGCILCPNNVKGIMCRVSNTSWAHLWCIYGTKFIDNIDTSLNEPTTDQECCLCRKVVGCVGKCSYSSCIYILFYLY